MYGSCVKRRGNTIGQLAYGGAGLGKLVIFGLVAQFLTGCRGLRLLRDSVVVHMLGIFLHSKESILLIFSFSQELSSSFLSSFFHKYSRDCQVEMGGFVSTVVDAGFRPQYPARERLLELLPSVDRETVSLASGRPVVEGWGVFLEEKDREPFVGELSFFTSISINYTVADDNSKMRSS